MTINIERNGSTLRITLPAELTAMHVPDLQGMLKQELEQDTKEAIFDLGNTTILDSSGIGLLIATSNTLAKKQGNLRLIRVSPDIMQLLRSMRLVSRLNANA
jgi:anti-sigma B factor antagonist